MVARLFREQELEQVRFLSPRPHRMGLLVKRKAKPCSDGKQNLVRD